MIFDMYALFVSRFLMGIAVGGYTTTVPLYISEISPISFMSMLGSLVQIQANLGSTITFAVAFAAPYSDDSDVNTNQNWRLIIRSLALKPILILKLNKNGWSWGIEPQPFMYLLNLCFLQFNAIYLAFTRN